MDETTFQTTNSNIKLETIIEETEQKITKENDVKLPAVKKSKSCPKVNLKHCKDVKCSLENFASFVLFHFLDLSNLPKIISNQLQTERTHETTFRRSII